MRQRCLVSTLGLAICLLLGFGSDAHAQATQVKPWFLLAVDTSGSMDDQPPNVSNSCGFGSPNFPHKMNAAKCAIQRILNSVGDAEFGLAQFAQSQNCNGSTCDASAASGLMRVSISPTGAGSILPLVDGAGAPTGFGCNDTCPAAAQGNNTQELCAGGFTPLAGVLKLSRQYFSGAHATFPAPTRVDGTAMGCRPMSVILLTDGEESCSGTPATDAANLLSSTFIPTQGTTTACTADTATCDPKAIKTYVIGFGVASGNAAIEAIAEAGGTDNAIDGAGGLNAYYASDEAALSAALNQIILDSQLTEVCDGDDDDCDTFVDEGYAKYCDFYGRRTTNGGQANLNTGFPCVGMTCPPVPGLQGNAICAAPEWSQSVMCSPRNLLCTSPGERCNQNDDDCDGRNDEGAAPLIGVSDLCDLVDQDCDGSVDENCVPSNCGPEICDNLDNDCDTRIDEGLGRRCGTDVGDCVAGDQTCRAGQWGAVNPATMAFQVNFCPGVAPATETCNNEDDDCNGIVDRITQACTPYGTTLECTAGIETCIAGVWQSTGPNPDNAAQCIGAKGPTADICDNKNNDCAPTPDGSADSRVGVGCGNDKGICNLGTTVCTAGNVVCNDPDESQNEVCDNLDNDCDGKIDENPVSDPLPRVGTACFPDMPDPPAVIGECRTGTYACVGGSFVCQNFKGPSPEICDGKDNDCQMPLPTVDGAQDPAVGQSCGTDTGECNPGNNICSGGAIVCSGRTGPVFELCDGKDNDCDFKTDEDLPDDAPRDGVLDAVTRCDAAGGLMDVGACDWGQRRCVQTGPASWALQCTGGVGPVLETCDGEDNDCDGTVDECAGARNSPEYLACTNAMVAGVPVGPLGAGGGKACGTSVAPCTPGLTKCVADVNPGNADPTEPGFVCVGGVLGMEEVCNNADDDCDTKVDEELDPANDPRLDVACSDGINIPACREPGDPNEPCGRCKFGHTVCVSGAVACTGAIGNENYEFCNGGDDDCDGDVDECVDLADPTCAPGEVNPATPVGGVCAAGQCQSGFNKCINGKLECEGSLSGSVEQCNNLDDDCDGKIDEGFNKGAPCTESGMEAVGECRPGVIACDPDPASPTGIICINERKPVAEVCNTLDDDCDRVVDEGLGLGDACGSAEGLCEPGKLACVSGRSVCTGEVKPRPETCDCVDNDCDGKIDEDTADEPVCQLGQCVMCQCALPCAKQMEFAPRCPQGKAPVELDAEQCFCVGELCKQSECQASTIEVDGQVRCAPDDDKVGTCLCRNNECSFHCAGVTCEAGLICDPTDGRCTRPTCLLAQFACEDGQRCGLADNAWSCMDDPCANNSCDDDEACRDGACVPSCGSLTCSTGQRCIDGVCEQNPCFAKNCDPGLVCNPVDGECVLAGQCVGAGCGDGQVCDVVGGDCEEDPCLRTRCPRAEKCNSDTGQCEPRCFGTLLLCDDKCINPMTSRDHCGASEDCGGDNVGVVCEAGLVCSQGTCSDTCSDGLINCGSECIDPQRDIGHCGASGDCQGDNDGALCTTGFSCEAGKCKSINPGGEGGSGGGGQAPDGTRVIASGGGGCTCSVPGAADPVGRDGQRGPLAGLLFALLAIGLGRKRRLLARARGAALTAGALLLAVLLGGSGCKVDTYCLDCPKPGDEPKAGDDGFGGTTGGSGGRGGRGGSGGTSDDGSVSGADGGDAMVMRPDGGCVADELCNGFDDDCDDKVDEGTNPAAENIDIDGDALNCGRCGNVCALPHAFNKCVAAACVIDQTQGNNGCDVGFFDLDGDNDNGCEYRCTRTMDSDALCDLVDNDCDGEIDEDVDLKTDTTNCGACGFRCTFARASAGGVCNDGVCELDGSKCDSGYADPDGQDANGCEYACPVFPVQAELCNFIDDDCDLVIDDGVATTDPQVGAACGISEGACEAGHYECQTGALACVGAVVATVEVCDGIDNDCDGEIDSDHPDNNLPCGDVVAGSECEQGNLRIPGGLSACAIGPAQPLECFGGQGPVSELCDGLDNDCDGKVDEEENGFKPEEDQRCINEAGGIQVLAADPAHWTAATVCKTGRTVCVAGNLVCRNEVAPEQFEKCDALDHDCDGNALNGFTFVGGIASVGPDPDLGDACGVDTGECAFGQLRCHQATSSLECDNQTPAVPELCNGKDDDCDGQIDDATPSAPVGVGLPCKIETNGMMTSGAGVTATSPCLVGTTVCAAGKLACPNYTGPTAELCDNVDQDCDGVLAEATFPADSRINASCDTDGKTLGICNTGQQECNAAGTQIVCRNEVFAAAELCDGLDNDCDGENDDGSAETWLGQPCQTLPDGSVTLTPAATMGTCRPGVARCVGGRQACELEIRPALETCDATSAADLTNPAYDQDCDGTVDDDFLLASNVNRCGLCNNDCVPMQPNANMVCTAGACAISSCKPGYYDSKLVAGPDCSLRDPTNCVFTGQEVCDGKDNDCDALVDESTVAEPMYLPAANVFCLQLGKCATSATACRTHKIGNPDNVSCTGFGDATCVTEPVCTVRPSAELCNAPFDQETSLAFDEDCDGVSDSVEFNLMAACVSTGTGACARPGNLACNPDPASTTDTYCVNGAGAPVTPIPAPAGAEASCNNLDDDCDGDVDEACGMPGTAGSCVTDTWVTLPSGAQIYAYEASRRDATGSSSGTSSARACSVVGRVPWGNLTWDQAQTACEAIDPQGRLCTEEEWQSACQGGSDVGTSSCNWSFSTLATCNTYANNTCNGLDFVPAGDPIEPTGWTGTPAMASTCYRPYATGNLFDLSGNVKEYVDQRLDNTIPVRGGAYNNTSAGIACGFDFSVWPNPGVAKFPNVGFRCCRGAAAPRCVTVKALDSTLPVVAASGNSSTDDLSSSITVSLPGTTTITDVNVVVTGTHGDFEDVRVIRLLSPDGTTATLRNAADNSCTNGVDGFNIHYDDQATPTTLSCTERIGQGIPTKSQGGSALAAFNGEDPEGTWTITLEDNENDGGSSSPGGNGDQVNSANWRIETFQLKICAD